MCRKNRTSSAHCFSQTWQVKSWGRAKLAGSWILKHQTHFYTRTFKINHLQNDILMNFPTWSYLFPTFNVSILLYLDFPNICCSLKQALEIYDPTITSLEASFWQNWVYNAGTLKKIYSQKVIYSMKFHSFLNSSFSFQSLCTQRISKRPGWIWNDICIWHRTRTRTCNLFCHNQDSIPLDHSDGLFLPETQGSYTGERMKFHAFLDLLGHEILNFQDNITQHNYDNLNNFIDFIILFS